ncbi:MAG: 30S ribosomal protein S1, partial [Alphaproteobacteria bacterium]|nr:30S ribosomal protein S1 [Alphaproteobacteria bacterium]
PAEPEAETPAEPEAETPAEPEAEVVQPAVVKKSDLPEGYETSEAARLRLLREKDEKAAAKKTKEE